jgi:hypothetical protein
MYERATQAVVGGSAAPRDPIRHSRAGTVELVTVAEGPAARDQCLLCGELTDELLRSVPAYVAVPAVS